MKKIKIGLLGVGGHTIENIIPSIKLNKISKITSVYSSSRDKLNKLSFDYDIENLYLTTEELIDSKIDCAFIAGSPVFHESLVLKCIEKNLPFFVEKPPLKSLESFKLIENLKLPTNFVGYNFRYFDQYLKVEKMLENEVKKHLTVKYLANKPDKQLWDLQTVVESYLYAVAIHPIELVLNTFGKYKDASLQFQRVSAHCFVLNIFVFFENGQTALIELGNYSNKLDFQIDIVLESGKSVNIDNLNRVTFQTKEFIFDKKEDKSFQLSGSAGGYSRTGYQNEVDDFLKSVSKGRNEKTSSDILNSIEVYRLIDQVVKTLTSKNFIF